LIFAVGLISSIIITSNSSTGICQPGNGCDTVTGSSYGSTLGIKNSTYGIFIFSFMILLTLFHINKPNRHTRRIIHSMMIISSIVAIYFLYLQIFIIKAYCKFCLVVDFALLIGLIFMFYLWEH
jgi:uncharacterized membrane protein